MRECEIACFRCFHLILKRQRVSLLVTTSMKLALHINFFYFVKILLRLVAILPVVLDRVKSDGKRLIFADNTVSGPFYSF